jgi:hypothetical protein
MAKQLENDTATLRWETGRRSPKGEFLARVSLLLRIGDG